MLGNVYIYCNCNVISHEYSRGIQFEIQITPHNTVCTRSEGAGRQLASIKPVEIWPLIIFNLLGTLAAGYFQESGSVVQRWLVDQFTGPGQGLLLRVSKYSKQQPVEI